MDTKVEQDAPAMNAALPHVQEVLRTAEHELAGLLQQRDELIRRIGTIKQMLSGMANLFGESILSDELRVTMDGQASDRRKGFTRACRQILMQSRAPLPLRDFLEELRRRFPELADRHKDLSASMTTVFHRLAGYGEVRCFANEKGTRVWEWIAGTAAGDNEMPSLDLESTIQPVPPQTEQSRVQEVGESRSRSALSEGV